MHNRAARAASRRLDRTSPRASGRLRCPSRERIEWRRTSGPSERFLWEIAARPSRGQRNFTVNRAPGNVLARDQISRRELTRRVAALLARGQPAESGFATVVRLVERANFSRVPRVTLPRCSLAATSSVPEDDEIHCSPRELPPNRRLRAAFYYAGGISPSPDESSVLARLFLRDSLAIPSTFERFLGWQFGRRIGYRCCRSDSSGDPSFLLSSKCLLCPENSRNLRAIARIERTPQLSRRILVQMEQENRDFPNLQESVAPRVRSVATDEPA